MKLETGNYDNFEMGLEIATAVHRSRTSKISLVRLRVITFEHMEWKSNIFKAGFKVATSDSLDEKMVFLN